MKYKKSITDKINEINELLPIVNDLGDYAVTYNGGTYPSFVILTQPIEIKNQYVYIYFEKSPYNYDQGKVRFNLNKTDQFDESGEAQLLYDLKIILKAFKKLIKEVSNENY